MRKTLKWIGYILSGIIIICLALCLAAFIMTGGIFIVWPNPPKPVVTHGEFDFYLKYEVDGAQYTVSDTIIYDYKIRITPIGKKMYLQEKLLKRSKVDIILIKNIDNDKNLLLVTPIYDYLMGDPYNEITSNDGTSFPRFYIESEYESSSDRITEQELLEKYNFKVLESYIDPPIENSLKNSVLRNIYEKVFNAVFGVIKWFFELPLHIEDFRESIN